MSIFPTKILLATDGSGDAELASTTAVGLARSSSSELHVVHTWRTVPSVHFDTLIRQEMEREAQGVLDGQVKQIEGLGGIVAQARLSEGGAVEEIVALAEEIGAGLIAVGRRLRGSDLGGSDRQGPEREDRIGAARRARRGDTAHRLS
jgi:nucleotide-binding universal stress UspA family protein